MWLVFNKTLFLYLTPIQSSKLKLDDIFSSRFMVQVPVILTESSVSSIQTELQPVIHSITRQIQASYIPCYLFHSKRYSCGSFTIQFYLQRITWHVGIGICSKNELFLGHISVAPPTPPTGYWIFFLQ
jgi:hypothetical protein